MSRPSSTRPSRSPSPSPVIPSFSQPNLLPPPSTDPLEDKNHLHPPFTSASASSPSLLSMNFSPLPSRLAEVELDESHHPSSEMSGESADSSHSHSTATSTHSFLASLTHRRPSQGNEKKGDEANHTGMIRSASDEKEHDAMVAALRLSHELDDVVVIHSPTNAITVTMEPVTKYGTSKMDFANRDDDEKKHSDDDDDDFGVEEVGQLGSKTAPVSEDIGKGSSSPFASSNSPPPSPLPITPPMTSAPPQTTTTSARAIRAILDSTTQRGAKFGIEEQKVLAEKLKEAAFDRSLMMGMPSALSSVSPPSQQSASSKPSLTPQPPAQLSASDVNHYFVSAPLLYQDSASISPPHPNFVIHSRSRDARQLFEQTVQALFLHAAQSDFIRKERPLTKEQIERAQQRSNERKQQRRQRAASISASTGLSPQFVDESDEEIEEAQTELLSLTAPAAGKSASAPSPIDPDTNKELKSLLQTLEDAFDESDSLTRKVSAPFRERVSSTLKLAQSTYRLHQARLDSMDSRYSTKAFSMESSVPLFNVYYSQENIFLNSKLNEVNESLAYEKDHPRLAEVQAAAQSALNDASNGSSLSSSGSSSKKPKKSSFWCCCGGSDEPDIPPQTRPSVAAENPNFKPIDDTPITKWSNADFHAGYEKLLHILLQFELTIDMEVEEDERAERLADSKKGKIASVLDVDFNLVKHPDEIAQDKLLANGNSDAAAEVPSNEEERIKTVPVFTSRTLNFFHMRALSDESKKILQRYCEIWRVGLPFTVSATIDAFANNLNYNNPEWYSYVFNQLSVQSALYQSHSHLVQRRSSRDSTPNVPTSLSSSQSVSMPFTLNESDSFKRQVRDLWEWTAIQIRRYQFAFTPTKEDQEKDAKVDEYGAEIPPEPASMDGFKEALHLYFKLFNLMKELNLPISTAPGYDAAVASSTYANSSQLSAHETLKALISSAVSTHYEYLVETTRPIVSPSSPDNNSVLSPTSAAAVLERPKITSALHLQQLVRALTREFEFDRERSLIFTEVSSTVGAPMVPTYELSSSDRPRAPSVSSTGAFNLLEVTYSSYFAALWVDTRTFLRELSDRHGDLTSLLTQSRRAKTIQALQEIESQLPSILALYTILRDFHRIVDRSISNAPKFDVAKWFDPFVRISLAKCKDDWLVNGGSPGPMLTAILAQPFDARIDPADTAPRRHSASLEELFTAVRVIGMMLKDLPLNSIEIEEFAKFITQTVCTYIRSIHLSLQTTLDRELRKKTLWGMHVGTGGNMEPALPVDVMVKLNDLYVVRVQLTMLLDQLDLKRMWSTVSPKKAMMVTEPTTLKQELTPTSNNNSSQHSPELPNGSTQVTPDSEEDRSKKPFFPTRPSTPSDSPDIDVDYDIPAATLDLLDCRDAFVAQEACLEDSLARIVAGLTVFLDQHIRMVLWKTSPDGEEEWTGRHTKEEIEPAFTYMQRHWNYLRLFLVDDVLNRLMAGLLTDIVLILEKELVHPRKQSYKHRLKTEQVHRLIQIHYLSLDAFDRDFHLPTEYIDKLKATHLNRLEALETLLTAGSDTLVAEFDKIDPKVDEANLKLPFAARENYRLTNAPYLSRRQLAGAIKAREELEGDQSSVVTAFIKQHKGGLFSTNFFQ